ncbi:MAG: hypothetical protein OEZ21_10625 [Candidatus Bathyarchaeota archaeon]|nr:hypothetical protein [Candidatus Bathyarchaeota archaeon]
MPHVVLNGKVYIKDIFDKVDPLFVRNGVFILKTSNTYIDREEKSILIESLVIEEGNKTSFFTMISRREDGILVRIYPDSEVEKTDGVKRILAETAKQLLEKFPDLRVGKTNLSDL